MATDKRSTLDQRVERHVPENMQDLAQRRQHRFRKSPERYLANLEEKPIKERLPS